MDSIFPFQTAALSAANSMFRCMASARLGNVDFLTWRAAYAKPPSSLKSVARPCAAGMAAMEMLLRLVLRAFKRMLVFLMPLRALALEALGGDAAAALHRVAEVVERAAQKAAPNACAVRQHAKRLPAECATMDARGFIRCHRVHSL